MKKILGFFYIVLSASVVVYVWLTIGTLMAWVIGGLACGAPNLFRPKNQAFRLPENCVRCKYVGAEKSLLGELAIVRFENDFCVAQFENIKLFHDGRYMAFIWTEFNHSDFRVYENT